MNDSEDPIILDAPQVLVGNGAIGLLGKWGGAPENLHFTNDLGKSVWIYIFVGREAIEEIEV